VLGGERCDRHLGGAEDAAGEDEHHDDEEHAGVANRRRPVTVLETRGRRLGRALRDEPERTDGKQSAAHRDRAPRAPRDGQQRRDERTEGEHDLVEHGLEGERRADLGGFVEHERPARADQRAGVRDEGLAEGERDVPGPDRRAIEDQEEEADLEHERDQDGDGQHAGAG
jgi:hypothetical protein